MTCPNCKHILHISHIGVTICPHCWHIGQVASKPVPSVNIKPSSKLQWAGSHKFMSIAIVIIALQIVTVGGLVMQQSDKDPAVVAAPVKAVKPASPIVPQAVVTPSTSPAPAAVVTPPKSKPAPAATTATQPPSYIVSNALCRVDATQAPDMLARANEMASSCLAAYPQLVSRLSPTSCQAPHVIVLDQNQYAAYAQNCVVHVSINWLRNSAYDPGVVPHELTHTVQEYGSIAPGWITEGIATYMSYKLGYSIGIAHCNSNENYLSGYGCGASLFNYIERVYWPSVIKDVHGGIKANTYTDSIFQSRTGGRTLDALYAECRNTECRGGK